MWCAILIKFYGFVIDSFNFILLHFRISALLLFNCMYYVDAGIAIAVAIVIAITIKWISSCASYLKKLSLIEFAQSENLVSIENGIKSHVSANEKSTKIEFESYLY